MATINNKGVNDPLLKLALGVRTELAGRSGEVTSPNTVSQITSMESLSAENRDVLFHSLEGAAALVRSALGGVVGFESMAETMEHTDASLQAAAVAALASGDPSNYARTALTSRAQAGNNVILVESDFGGPAGSIDSVDDVAPGLEAYDERNLAQFAHYSVVYNLQASRQDAFGEAFFPTVTVSPDQGGLDVTIQSMLVFREYRHPLTGRAADFKKRNLIDGFVDYTLLSDEETKIVPYRAADNSNASSFIASGLVAPYNVLVGGVSVTTAPYKIGEELDILGLSSHPSIINGGVMDNTDALDSRIGLSAFYVNTGAGAAVRFATTNLARSYFTKTVEGHYRDMSLQFPIRDLYIDKDTKAVDGTVVAAFAPIVANNFTVRVSVDFNGMANAETGNVSVTATKLKVLEIRDQAGNQMDLTAGAPATVVAAIAACSVDGYDLEARRTNSNRRTRGTLLDTAYFTERYSIPLGSPISIPRPVASDRDASDLRSLISATRIRNSNDAVTTLLNYASTLDAYVKGPKFTDQAPAVVGSGRHYVTPFYEDHPLDMLNSTNSIKSHEKAMDVSAALVNAIRDVAYRMLRDSKYLPALQVLTGGTEETPRLVIGTDPVIARHLMVSGDTRTFGDAFKDFDIVSSPDRRMRNTIFVTLSRRNAAAPDPLSFGCMAWMPEMTGAVDITRNNAVSREVMVQPRKLHVPLLPVLAKITVSNLSLALAEKIGTPATSPAATGTWDDDILYP